MSLNGVCPKCGREYRDFEPGDTVRCVVYETHVTLELPDGYEQ